MLKFSHSKSNKSKFPIKVPLFVSVFKKLKLFLIVFVIFNVGLALITHIPSRINPSDAQVFREFYGFEQPTQPLNIDQQIQLITATQHSVLNHIPFGTPIPEYSSREPEDLILNKTGLCYDRSRTLDKFYTWLGFQSRHVYILYLKHPVSGEPISFLRAFFTYGIESHAVTEVKTLKGWMLVDSNSKWISLTRNGEPVNADDIFRRAAEFDDLPDAFNKPYIAIRGLYSRRGHFYRPYIPYPELNWIDFLTWLFAYD